MKPNLNYISDTFPVIGSATVVKQQLMITTSGIKQQKEIMSILFIPLLNGNTEVQKLNF